VTWRTTIRGAAGMFAESIAIAGGDDSSCQPVSTGGKGRIMGRILQAFEMLLLPFARGKGEELVVVAKKSDSASSRSH